jgi:hypothetical protein
VNGEDTRTVFVEIDEAPTGTVYTLGPAEVTGDIGAANDQQVWQAVPDTEDLILPDVTDSTVELLIRSVLGQKGHLLELS